MFNLNWNDIDFSVIEKQPVDYSLPYLWTWNATSKKVGGLRRDVAVTTVSNKSCPVHCPFKGNGCYAYYGPLRFLWDKLSDSVVGSFFKNGRAPLTPINIVQVCRNVISLDKGDKWRYAQAGDLQGDTKRINFRALVLLVIANQSKRGWTYCHYKVIGDSAVARHNRECIKFANQNGFTINMSANNEKHESELRDYKIGPVAMVAHSKYGQGKKESAELYEPRLKLIETKTRKVCPATKTSEDSSCSRCMGCQLPSFLSPDEIESKDKWAYDEQGNRVTFIFPGHGSGKKYSDKIAGDLTLN